MTSDVWRELSCLLRVTVYVLWAKFETKLLN